MDKEQARKLWESIYGTRTVAYDFAAQEIHKEDYKNSDSFYNWEEDFIRPLSSGGVNNAANRRIASKQSVDLRREKSSFRIGNGLFEVRKGRRFGTYALYDVTDRNHPLSREVSKENQDEFYNRNRFNALYGVKQDSFLLKNPKNIQDVYFKENTKDLDLTSPDIVKMPLEEEENDEPRKSVSLNEEKPAVAEEKPLREDKPKEAEAKTTPVVTTDDTTQEDITEPIRHFGWKPEPSAPVRQESEGEEKAEPEENPSSDGLKQVNENLRLELQEREKDILLLKEENGKLKETNESLSLGAKEKRDALAASLKEKEELLTKREEKNSQDALSLSKRKDEQTSLLNQTLDENSSLKREKDALTQEKDRLRKEKEEREISLSSLRKEKEDLTFRLSSLEEEKKKNREDYQISRIEWEKKEGERNSSLLQLQKEKEDRRENLSLSRQDKDKNRNEVSSLKEDLLKKEEEWKNQSLSLNETIDSLKSSLSSLEDEKKKIEEEYAAYQSQAEENKKKSEEESLTLQEEKKQIQDRLNLVEAEKNKLVEEKTALEARNSEKESLVEKTETVFKQRQDELKEKLDALNKQREEKDLRYGKLKKDYEELDALSSLKDDQKAQLENEIKELNATLDKNKADRETLSEEKENLSARLNQSKADFDSLTKEKEELSSQLKSAESERNHRRQTSRDYNTKLTNLSKEYEEAKADFEKMKEDYSKEISSLNKEKEDLSSQLSEKEKQYLFYLAGGEKSAYDSFLFYRNDTSTPFDEEHVRKAIQDNPSFKRKEDNGVYPIRGEWKTVESLDASFVDRERASAAFSSLLFDFYFGKDKNEACDFSGRIRKRDQYGLEESNQGWTYGKYDTLLDDDKKSSYYLVNRKTAKDLSLTKPFTTNSHNYHLEKGERGYHFVSLDDVYDIYDLPKAREITALNEKKTTPVLYLFVKRTPINGEDRKGDDVKAFFDLLDRTVYRACPSSFRERKGTLRRKESYAFLTFDGTKEGAYKEVLSYATLLNSYRNAFKKENKLNAVIVLDQVRLPFSFRHLSFENRLSETNDKERKAVYYHLLQRPMVDSTIKRTIHIGPSILPRLNLPSERLTESSFISPNFALIYNFKNKFVRYNYGYEIKK